MEILKLNTSESPKIGFKNYWYILCQSSELKKDEPMSKTILDEWVVVFRDENNNPKAFQDRCIHRNFQLSKGQVKNGCLKCPYHGWTFDKEGTVVDIPSEGENFKIAKSRKVKTFEVMEKDDFIYVRLESHPTIDTEPFSFPKYKEKGYKTIRLFNKFENNVTNCAENYVDVPHTVFVHDKIFRVPKQERIDAVVERQDGVVKIEYKNEKDNFGWFSWFLNPSREPIYHADYFHSPNVTSVVYKFGSKKEFYISSHCIPINDQVTHVYTDLTFNFGLWNLIAGPMVKYQGQAVIDQDIVVLNNQMKTIKKYGTDFQNSRADIVHVLIESLREEIEKGKDPMALPYKKHEFEFWV